MKYILEIDIDLPRDRVVELFDNVENLYEWNIGLQNFEHISGEPGEVGAKSKLTYKVKNREFVLIETVTEKKLPDQFSGTYEAKNVYNGIDNYFEEAGENKTKWIAENEFKPSGFLKFIVWLMPGAFKKQSFKYMESFKKFAEEQGVKQVATEE